MKSPNININNRGCPCVWGKVLRIKMSYWWMFLLMSMKCPFPCLLINFGLMSTLLDIRIVGPAGFLGVICLENLFLTLYSEVTSVFDVGVCFLYAAERQILFSHPFC